MERPFLSTTIAKTMDISGEDGEIDRALSFSKPSEVPLFFPFKTCKNPEDGMFECVARKRIAASALNSSFRI